MPRKPKPPKTIAALKHKEAKRKNIPTAEYQSVMQKEDQAPVKVVYTRGTKVESAHPRAGLNTVRGTSLGGANQ